jgi:hypothetical protein
MADGASRWGLLRGYIAMPMPMAMAMPMPIAM